jgi:hypothetical protein
VEITKSQNGTVATLRLLLCVMTSVVVMMFEKTERHKIRRKEKAREAFHSIFIIDFILAKSEHQ